MTSWKAEIALVREVAEELRREFTALIRTQDPFPNRR